MKEIIVFSGNNERIICAKGDEKSVYKDYFGPGSGRDIDEYEVDEAEGPVLITSMLRESYMFIPREVDAGKLIPRVRAKKVASEPTKSGRSKSRKRK